jgi:phosphatidate cytidylyltransferase
MNNNYLARVIVAIIFIPTILWISYQGGWWLFGMTLAFAVIAISEFLINEGYTPKSVLFWISLLAVLILFADATIGFFPVSGLQVPKLFFSFTTIPVIASFFLISGVILSINKSDSNVLFTKQSRLLWGVVYIGLLYPIVFLLGWGIGSLHGGDLLLFLLGIIWVGDTAAMEIGKRWGKRKLSPTISPNKTVEGFTSGLIGSILVAILMYYWKFQDVALYHLLLIAIGCSLFGQLGDLVESMWKRSLNIKDSSSIIPGHGGVLDRFDSLLFAAPFMYFYFQLLLFYESS